MLQLLEIVSLLLVAVAMALSLAHALELPGKMRLEKAEYLAVQPIYYPGFTIGGAAEPLGVLALLVLLFSVPLGAGFWLVAGAFAALAAAHAVYWGMTHPVNDFWLKDTRLSRAGIAFFGTGRTAEEQADWRALRAQWEWSHVIRAGLSVLSFILLAAAVSLAG
ncbi:DUF1772 domain-containing protein [Kumtagia ephedrae]|jgi:hypothetical protein|uniref:DUF1772 domain-containing protein n=1 Tax=Kumtagia ephedrae TaxID=2116701 RepID=A0A2P7SQQ2_9HYPH|nr:DUF1772 domain-containing protein [Mesorhizobium ephedrae]PSJ64824.1 DUF1772 domain-containing protein [Mesorhizobium ephedrae]